MTTRLADGLLAAPLNILVIAASLAPSVSIGILRPMLSLERAGAIKWRLLLEKSWSINDIRAADVVVFCRNQSIDAYLAVLLAKHEGKKVIYEVDDNFFEMPINTSLGKDHRQPTLLHTMRRMLELADVTRVYNGKMAELAHSFGANVHHSRVYFDESLIKNITRKKSPDKVRIAFASGRSPDPLVEQALEEALSDIIQAHPENVEIHFWRSPSSLLKGRPQVVVNPGIADYDEFIRKFYASGYDIGLAPLLNTSFYRSKTNSKYREYGGCGVAGIYSNSSTYTECVEDEKTGLIVDNSREGWRAAILRLVENKELRRSISENAQADVKENYSYLGHLKAWQNSLQRAVTSNNGRPSIKPLLFHRNIAISAKALREPLGSPKSLQVQSIRGAEWSSASHFVTNRISHFGSSGIMEGPGVINWLVADEPGYVDEASLRVMNQAGIGIICDVRSYDLDAVTALSDRLASCVKHLAIVVCNVEQATTLGIDNTDKLANVEHPEYPRPQSFPTTFGYGVVAPRSRPLLDDISLSGPEGIWLELLDTISILHPMGRPVASAPYRWYPSRLRTKLQLRHRRALGLQDLFRSVLLRSANRIYRLRWQHLRWMIQSDAAMEDQIRHISHIQEFTPSTRPEKMDQ